MATAFVTQYWIKDWCGPDGDYVQADYDRDAFELEAEVQAVNPRVVLALGRAVARWFLGDVDMDEVHGIPWRLPIGSERRALFAAPDDVEVIVPIHNPAAGFLIP